MREIKFRAWDDKNKRWLLGYELPNLGGFSLTGECVVFGEWSNCVSGFIHDFDSLKIMQFTGLLDKNGVEIYEGDILEANFTHASWWFYSNPRPTGRDGYSTSKGICTVKWPYNIDNVFFPKKDFWFKSYPTLEEEFKSRLPGTKIENERSVVIGNIYQHPNLLKDGN